MSQHDCNHEMTDIESKDHQYVKNPITLEPVISDFDEDTNTEHDVSVNEPFLISLKDIFKQVPNPFSNKRTRDTAELDVTSKIKINTKRRKYMSTSTQVSVIEEDVEELINITKEDFRLTNTELCKL
ncbi:hypothetical protein AKO1_005903 [Acrasis kona]|uniref:Uncharacterized protein n=1 Tax=Acrasis kona TaxID=1008807 RepID=A0AAW2YJL1_9EUKA